MTNICFGKPQENICNYLSNVIRIQSTTDEVFDYQPDEFPYEEYDTGKHYYFPKYGNGDVGIFAQEPCDKCNSLNYPYKIKKILDYSDTFYNFDSEYQLENLEEALLLSVEVIGRNGFMGCSKLKSLQLKKDVIFDSSSTQVFTNCCSLTSDICYDNIIEAGPYCFYNCANISKVELTNLTFVKQAAFSYCNKLSTITVGNCTDTMYLLDENGNVNTTGVMLITKGHDNTDENGEKFLKWASIPNSINVKIPDDVKILANQSLAGCINLKDLDLNNVSSICDGALYDCNELTGITISSENFSLVDNKILVTNTSSEYSSYEPKTVIFATKPNTVNVNLDSYDISAIERNAFKDCVNLKSFVGNNIKILKNGCFNNCQKLSSLELQSVVMTPNTYSYYLYNNVFDNCQNLSSVSFTSLTQCNNLFKNCQNLTSIYIPNLSVISTNIAIDCQKLSSLSINTNSLSTFLVDENKNVGLSGNIMYYLQQGYDGNNPKLIWSANNVVSIDIDSFASYIVNDLSIDLIDDYYGAHVYIDDYACYNCKSLEEVKFDYSVSSILNIGNYAFYGCENLTTIPVLNGNIGERAFANCTNLDYITLSCDDCCYIRSKAFENCTNLKNIDLLSYDVCFYEDDAFDGCNYPINIWLDNKLYNHIMNSMNSDPNYSQYKGLLSMYKDNKIKFRVSYN